jgi:hypothetical protein
VVRREPSRQTAFRRQSTPFATISNSGTPGLQESTRVPLTVMHSTMMPKTAVWLLETALFPPATRPAPRLITGRWLFFMRVSFPLSSPTTPGRRPGKRLCAHLWPGYSSCTQYNGGPQGPPFQVKLLGRPVSKPVVLVSV